MQQDRELLILKILKIPVKLIKWASRFTSMLTYLPNYFIILVLDLILFNQKIDSSFSLYCILWPLRVVALQLIPTLFIAEFWAVFYFLDLSQHSLAIQLIAMFLVLAGSLILMRKGYLSFIKQFDPMKLKSPLQHIVLYGQYFTDLIGIILAMINILLVINSLKTISYEYNQKQRKYPKYIYKLIKQSILEIIKFFYVKIFFRLFKWRYNASLQEIKKQQNNILNLFVLLTLLYIYTCIDLVFLIISGWIPLIHPKRLKYYRTLQQDCRWWRVILLSNLFILVQATQLILIQLGIIKWKLYKDLFIKICSQQTLKDHHFKQVRKLLLLAAVYIPYLFCLLTIYIFRYKYNKKQKLVKQKPGQTEQFLTFYCFGDLVLQSIFFPLIILSTLFKPWNYFWLKMLVDDQGNLKTSFIYAYFIKSLCDVFWIFATIIFSIILLIYNPGQVYRRMKAFYIYRKTQTHKQIIEGKSLLRKISQNFCKKIVDDLPHLGLLFVARVSFLWMFGLDQPQNAPQMIENVLFAAYKLKNAKSQRFQLYSQMYAKDFASGHLKYETSKMRFWKFVNKCQRYYKTIAILKLILPKRGVQKIHDRAYQKPQNKFSSLTNYYWDLHKFLWALFGYVLYLIINIIVSIFGIIFMLPITFWRMPTFFVIYMKHKKRLLFFKIVFKMYKQLVIDIYFFIVYDIITFILSPRYLIKSKIKNAFYYGQDGINTFEKIQQQKRKIIKSILHQSFQRFSILIKTILIILMMVKLKYFREKLKEQKVSLRYIFKSYFVLYAPIVKQKLKMEQQKKEEDVQKDKEKLFKKIKDEVDKDFIISLKAFIALLIEIILTLFAVLVLLPLTLWRLPTFFVLYLHHKDRMFTYRIIFGIYQQLVYDIIYLFVSIPAIILSPRHFLKFKLKNAYYYGKYGYFTFAWAQQYKRQILLEITKQSIRRLKIVLKAIMISLMWIRFKYYRQQLKNINSSFFNIFRIFMQCQVKTAKQVEQSDNKKQFFESNTDYFKFRRVQKRTNQIFNDAIRDLPYLLALILIQILMPWRFFYVKEVIVGFRQGFSDRRRFKKLVKNVTKDYLCIILTFFLILTIVKAKKAIKLALKNFRLNFFVGFLKYSYFQQLLNQLSEAAWFYHNIFFLLLAMIFDFPNATKIFNSVYSVYKQRKQDQRVKQENQKIYKRSVEEGKQLKILSKMGYTGFITLCKFLTMQQIANLSQANKISYQMTKQQQIWIEKWDRNYQQKYNRDPKFKAIKKNDNYEEMCIQAYKIDNKGKIKQNKKITYQEIVMEQLFNSLKVNHVNIKQLSKKYLSQQMYTKMFFSQQYDILTGFIQADLQNDNGPDGGEDHDQQILRLLEAGRRQQRANQDVQLRPVRNRRQNRQGLNNGPIQLTQELMFPYKLLFNPVQLALHYPDLHFSENSNRKKKQAIFLLSILAFIISYLTILYFFFGKILTFNSLFGIKVIVVLYTHIFLFVFLKRAQRMYQNTWIALTPFDLKQDIIAFFRRQKQRIIDTKNAIISYINRKLVQPTKNQFRRFKNYLSQKINQFKNWVRVKIIQPFKAWFARTKDAAIDRAIRIKNKIVQIIKKCWNFVYTVASWVYNKIKNAIITAFKFFYNNIAKPLYIYLSEKIVILARFIVKTFKFFKNSIILIFRKIGQLFINIFQGLKAIFRSLNNSYKIILEKSLRISLKFGMIGQLIFTIFGLSLMCLPLMGCYFLYWQRWFIIASSVWTMALILSGYKHLTRIKQQILIQNANRRRKQ